MLHHIKTSRPYRRISSEKILSDVQKTLLNENNRRKQSSTKSIVLYLHRDLAICTPFKRNAYADIPFAEQFCAQRFIFPLFRYVATHHVACSLTGGAAVGGDVQSFVAGVSPDFVRREQRAGAFPPH